MREGRRTSSWVTFRISLWIIVSALLFACENVVVSVVEVSEVEVFPPAFTLIAGDHQAASAVVTEAGGSELSGVSVAWTVDDPDIATVDSVGVVEARAPGITVVRASADGVSGAADVRVLRGPTIGFSTSTVDLDAVALDSVIAVEVDVENAGNGTLGALVVNVADRDGNPVAWLHAELLGTTAPTRLRLVVTPGGMEPGSYEAFAVVSSPAARSGSADVRVRLDLALAPDAEPPPEPDPEPPPEPEPGSACDVSDRTFDDDVEIPRDMSCVFTNVWVRGRLQLREGARLVATRLTVEEHLEANGALELVLTDSRVLGDLKLEKGGTATIRNSRFDGKLEIKSNRGAIALSDNTVREGIKLEDNRIGPFTLLRNTARNLECKENDPAPTGGGNVVSDKKTGQCAAL